MKERMTGKNFMKLIISIWCIAIIKAKSARKITTPIFFHPSKDDLSYLRREEKFQISPLDGAQYAKFSSIQSKQPGETMQNTTAKWNYNTRLKSKKKERNQSSKNHYYSHFYLKTKQAHANYAVRTAKRTGNALRQIYEAIISTWWTHLIYQTNIKRTKPSSIKRQPTAARRRETEPQKESIQRSRK